MVTTEPFAVDSLSAALAYYKLGWSLIPTKQGSKKPALPNWKSFQTNRADEQQIRDWFDKRDDLGLAVVLGNVSGGLTCRDFDKEAAYHTWSAQNPELAKTLPTAKSGRGYHVYFRSDLKHTKKFSDGELRGNGAIVVLPPSRHPIGCCYRWLSEPTLEIQSVATEVFTNPWSQPQSTQLPSTHRETELMASVSPSLSDSVSLSLCGYEKDEGEVIERIVDETQPTKGGERNHCLFRLARRLRGVPSFGSADANAVEFVVRRWHQRALPIIVTKPWSETWADFRHAWGNAKFPEGMNVVALANEIASNEILPPEALAYDSPAIQRLIGVCFQLQKLHGPGREFFLSYRDAGRLIGRDFKDAGRWLNLLVRDDILRMARRGNEKRAHRYRYSGPSWKEHGG